MNLEIYQQLCAESKILWTQHCLQRMQERDISRADVKNGIATGEIIEDYPDDFPNPSCLIFGHNVNGRVLHIVAGCDNINIYIIIFFKVTSSIFYRLLFSFLSYVDAFTLSNSNI